MRPLIRRLLVALIRRTPPPPITPHESLGRIVAEVDTATEEVWAAMRGDVVLS